MDLSKPMFELRIFHDHLYKMNDLYEGLSPDLRPCFLGLTRALPPVIFGERSEEKLLFVRVYVKIREGRDLRQLRSKAEEVNATMGISRPAFTHGWLDPWNETLALRKWADLFEAKLEES